MQHLLYLNELSLHNQYQNISEFEDAIKLMIQKLEILKTHTEKIKFYKSNLILSLSVINHQVFQSVFYSQIKKELQLLFKKELLDNSTFLNWQASQLQDNHSTYTEIQIDESVLGSSLAECYEQKLINNEVAAINFISSEFSSLNEFKVQKNEDVIQNFTSINSIVNLNLFLNAIPERLDYYVQDSTQFIRVPNCICSRLGQPAYRHIRKRTYWVFDDSHNTDNFHYEVYDHRRRHIGEATVDGELDKSKSENRTLHCR